MAAAQENQRATPREAYLNPDGVANLQHLDELLEKRGAHFYQRSDGSRGIEWPTLEEDLLAFEEVLQIIFDALVDDYYDGSDSEFRSFQLPDIIEILETSSPLFRDLAMSYGRRKESTSDHIWKVARMAVADGLPPEKVIMARIQALFHDMGKHFVVEETTQDQDGKIRQQLSRDPAHHHAAISALMLDELLYRVEGDLAETLYLNNPSKREEYSHPVGLHHGLEAVVLEHITPEELARLIAVVPESMANAVILMLADMGAAANPEYLSENIDALFKVIDAYSRQEGGELIFKNNPNALEEIIANSLARVIYEMQQDEWLSLSSIDDAMVINKIVAIMNNINLLLPRFEAIAVSSEQQKKLFSVISRALIVVAEKIETTLRKRAEKFQIKAETVIQFFRELFKPLVDKYSLPIMQSMAQV